MMTDRLVDALRLVSTLLFQAAAFRGYGDGPLNQPAVGVALRQAETLIAEVTGG